MRPPKDDVLLRDMRDHARKAVAADYLPRLIAALGGALCERTHG